jgi:hypothetical protein
MKGVSRKIFEQAGSGINSRPYWKKGLGCVAQVVEACLANTNPEFKPQYQERKEGRSPQIELPRIQEWPPK